MITFVPKTTKPKFMKLKTLLGSILFAAVLCPVTTSAQTGIDMVPFTNVEVNDDFWQPRLNTMSTTTINYAFNKLTSGAYIQNFANAAKVVRGEAKPGTLSFGGNVYDDGDVFKVVEGAAYVLSVRKDPKFEHFVDSLIDIIVSAQEADGYLYTNRTIANPVHDWAKEGRWLQDWNLSHETFNSGELIEAGVAYYHATGKDKLLKAAVKAADLMCEVFKPDGLHMAPGHAVVEMALVRLYELTGEKKYLDLCKFFLDCRGEKKFDRLSTNIRENGEYWQNHLPATEQSEAVGHGVRALYFYSGMADLVRLSHDADYHKAVDAIWENIVGKKIYLTGGLGSRDMNEAFGHDYELPNEAAYCETCAALANCFFNMRMFRLYGDAKYIDILERSLYNCVLDGYGLSGDKFYYVNKLETRGQDREPWFGTSCCPTNLCRIIPQVPGYVYATSADTLFVNLFIGSKGKVKMGKGEMELTQQTGYPWSGDVSLHINKVRKVNPTLKVRIPGWAIGRPVSTDLYRYTSRPDSPVVITINGERVDYRVDRGYAILNHKWKKGDRVEVHFPMKTYMVEANSHVTADRGKLAVERGPLVYCMEGKDNGGIIDNVVIDKNMGFTIEPLHVNGVKGMVALKAQAKRVGYNAQAGLEVVSDGIKLVPYFYRAHRGTSPMTVWMNADQQTLREQPFLDKAAIVQDGHRKFMEYTLKVDPEKPCDLVLTMNGQVNGKHPFDILCDGKKFSWGEVGDLMKGRRYERHHAIPYDMTKGKTEVKLRLEATNGEVLSDAIIGMKTTIQPDCPTGAKVVDWFQPVGDELQAHAFRTNRGTGTAFNRFWADGAGSEGLSFEMACKPEGRNVLMLLYNGGERDLRDFDVIVNGELVGHEVLRDNRPGEFYFVSYPVPEQATKGKKKMKVELRSTGEVPVGGVFYAYTLAK